MPALSGTVLVVDDDAAVRSALKFALEAEGLKVRVYDSAAALLAEVVLPQHGCMVVDYHMPVMDGLELIDILRARQVGLPVILVTERVGKDLHLRAARSGVYRLLEKPLSGSALLDGIRAMLEQRLDAV